MNSIEKAVSGKRKKNPLKQMFVCLHINQDKSRPNKKRWKITRDSIFVVFQCFIFMVLGYKTHAEKQQLGSWLHDERNDADILLMCSRFSHMSQDCSEFFTLSLSTNVCSQTSLQELEGTLILRHLQQFHCSSFIRSMANHFADEVSNEFCVFGLHLKESKFD